MEIYSRPASRFVAGFVGSPAMNFCPVSVAADNQRDQKVTLPDGTTIVSAIDLAETKAGEDLTMGIRADAVDVVAPAEGNTAGQAQVVERLGERTLVHARLRDGTMIVAQDAGISGVKAGDEVGLRFDGAGLHIFDAAGKAYHAG
jgi:multiple sugar transport system ATP-binding protein